MLRHKQAFDRQVDSLELLINNTRNLYEQKMTIYKNLWKKYSMGKLDVIRAQVAFSHLTDDAARRHNNQHFEDATHISVKARRRLDVLFVTDFIAAAKAREYDFMV